MINSRREKLKGFTLIEILIVVSIVSLVSISLYNAFSSGLKLWDRGQRFVVEEDIALFFDKFSQEIRNSYDFSKFKFKGRTYSISFPSMIRTSNHSLYKDEEERFMQQMGVIEYYFDFYKKRLYRREANYSKAVKQRYFPPRLLISKVQKVKFKYFYINEKGKLANSQSIDVRPNVIRIEVEYSDEKGRLRRLLKIINLPT